MPILPYSLTTLGKDKESISQKFRSLGSLIYGVYNPNVSRVRHLPNLDRVSILAATILLTYTLARLVDFPIRVIDFDFLGIFFSFQFGIRTIVAILVAGLAGSGADWLLRDHPAIEGESTFQHWLLPALTAWSLGIPLYQLPLGPSWWLGFLFGGALLMTVFIAEFIVIDTNDLRYVPASILLIAVSFALYLMMIVALRNAEVRLFLLLPAITIGMGFVSIRTLHLRLQGRLLTLPALIAAAVVAQIASALHYWPLSPISYGLALLGPAYSLISLIVGLIEEKTLRQIALEPLVVLTSLVVAALWLS